MRRYVIAIMMLSAVLLGGGAAGAPSGELALNTVEVTIDGRAYRFEGLAGGAVTDLGNGTVRYIIGLRDAARGVSMNISADVPEDRAGEELHLAADYAGLTMTYKSPSLQFIISPAILLARDSGMEYREKDARGAVKRRRADWMSMDRDERIARGKGVVRERRMEGSALHLVMRPVADSGRQELRGTFSGVATVYSGKKKGRPVVINGGRFRVEVIGQ